MDANQSYCMFATVYDALTSDVEYEKRCNYLEDIFKKHMDFTPSLIADLGCGTGSVCTILSSRGYDLIGIDASDMMLDIASKKKGSEKILYLNQDMCEFELYGTVDVFLCMLDSLNYITDIADVEKVFSLVENYLNHGGIFIFDVNTLHKYEKILADNTFVFEEKDVFYTWENNFDGEYCDYRLNFFVRDGNVYKRFTEEHSQRYHSHAELKKAIERAGLIIEAIYSELSFEKQSDCDERVFYVVKKH